MPLSLLLLLGSARRRGRAARLRAVVGRLADRIVLVPRVGWNNPVVRGVIRRAGPAAAQAALAAIQLCALLVVANRLAGGVVAFQLAANFYFLPIAVGATPVALSLMPRLSRLTGPDQARLFRDTYCAGWRSPPSYRAGDDRVRGARHAARQCHRLREVPRPAAWGWSGRIARTGPESWARPCSSSRPMPATRARTPLTPCAG